LSWGAIWYGYPNVLRSEVVVLGSTVEIPDGKRRHADRAVSLEAQLGGLYFSPEKAVCFG